MVAYDRVLSLSRRRRRARTRRHLRRLRQPRPEWDLAVERKVRIAAGQVDGGAGAPQARRRHRRAGSAPTSTCTRRTRPTRTCRCTIASTSSSPTASSSSPRPITTSCRNYAPVIEELGVGRYITSMVGDELTTNGWGHFGALPLTHDLERVGQGAVLVHGKGPQGLLRRGAHARARRHHRRAPSAHRQRDRLLQHRRLRRAQRSRRRAPASRFDFDAVEVLNGYQDSERRSVDRMIDDWFALLAARPHRHGDGQFRHAPPRPQHRRLSAQLRPRAGGPAAVAARPAGDAARGQGAPRALHHRAVRRAQGRRRRHRRRGAGARRRRQGRDRGARGAVGQRVDA